MKEKIISAVSYLWILFFLPLVLIPESAFGRFHANQALINFIVAILCAVVAKLLGWIPIIGWIIKVVAWVIPIAMLIWGVATALMGEKRPYPLVGGFQFFK